MFFRTARAMVLALCFVIASATGCSTIHRGTISVAPPKVFDHDTTVKSMARQAKFITADAREITAADVNQFSLVREAIIEQLRAKNLAGKLADEKEEAVAPPKPAEAKLPTSPLTTPKDYAALYSEALQDLENKEVTLDGLNLLLNGAHGTEGKRVSLYLVRWTVWIEPESQRWYQFFQPVLGLGLDARDYMEDYDVELTMTLPKDLNGKGLDVSFYSALPTAENITSVDGLANLSDRSVTASLADSSGFAAEAERRRLKERQFAELRKFPVIRSVLDSPQHARFIFSPRRRIVERSWLGKLFWSDYRVVRLLEPGVRTVYTIVKVVEPKTIKAKEAVAAYPPSALLSYHQIDVEDKDLPYAERMTAKFTAPAGDQAVMESAQSAAITSNALAEGRLDNELSADAAGKDWKVWVRLDAAYRELGSARQPDAIPFFGSYPYRVKRSSEKTPWWWPWLGRTFTLGLAYSGDDAIDVRCLPLTLPRRTLSKPAIGVKATERRLILTIPGARDKEWEALKLKKVDVSGKSLSSCALKRRKELDLSPNELQVGIESAGNALVKNAVYYVEAKLKGGESIFSKLFKLPESKPDPKPSMSPAFGNKGTLVTIKLPAGYTFKKLHFGGHDFVKGDKAIKKVDDKDRAKKGTTITVMAPESSTTSQVDVALTVDIAEEGKKPKVNVVWPLGKWSYIGIQRDD